MILKAITVSDQYLQIHQIGIGIQENSPKNNKIVLVRWYNELLKGISWNESNLTMINFCRILQMK